MRAFNTYDLTVLMTADTVGGVWTYAMELCAGLAEYNIGIYLVTMGGPLNAGQQRQVDQLQNTQLFESKYALEWMHEPWSDIDESGEWLLQLERELQPGIVHLNSFSYGALRWKSPAIVVVHSDVFSWWHAVKTASPPADWQQYYSRVKAGLSGADLVVAPSRSMLQHVVDLYDFSTATQVIYNGRSAGLFAPAKKECFVFSMGRIWDEAKNIQVLLRSAANIKCGVKIAGDNNFEDNHVDTAATNVAFLGRLDQSQVAEQLSKAAIAAFPCKYEPFGLGVLEAGLSGCALVLGDISSLREIWKDNAVYIDADDELAWANAINKLVQDEELRKAYANKALEHAKQFSTAAMTRQYVNQYRQLLENKGAYPEIIHR